MEDMQERLKAILDEHLIPFIPELWSDSFSLYEIGAIPDGDRIKEIIVWVRSTDMVAHVMGLMVPNSAMMVVDTVHREKLCGEEGWPRLGGETVLVRLFKQPDTESEGKIDLMVEIFQVHQDTDAAEETFDHLNKLLNRNDSPS